MKRILFIDRDGTLVKEAPPTYQLDDFSKLAFYPGALTYLPRIAAETGYELVLVSNQDGLGTESFPEAQFRPVHDHILKTFAGEGVVFAAEHIDPTMPHENAPTRKPGIGMLQAYLGNEAYDIANSFVIGDRVTDVQLAKNLGCKAIWLCSDPLLGASAAPDDIESLKDAVALETSEWRDVYAFLKHGLRHVVHRRTTSETDVLVELNLDGKGRSEIHTGLGFFDHMLDQIARHGRVDLRVQVKGDLHIDEHHTVEDTGIALGEAFAAALADKRGIERYGYALPMDDAEARVLIDFGGRSWIVWDAEFRRERVGDLPTEMFFHFFKSYSDAARCNLHVACRGDNEHHKIEAVFKAFARAIRMAVRRDPADDSLPSTKGML